MRARAPVRFILKGGVCGEIGVWKGDFSQEILDHGAGKLHLIDPWRSALGRYTKRWYCIPQSEMDKIFRAVQERFKGDPRVEIHRLTSARAARRFPKHYFDWLYVDGDHSYKFVYSDCDLYWPRIKLGGYLTGDDAAGDNEVYRAVFDFAHKRKLKVTWHKDAQFTIRKETAGG